MSLDGLEPLNHAIASEIAFRARDMETALRRASQAVFFGEDFWIGYMAPAQAHEQMRHERPALDALVRAAGYSNNNSKTLSLRGYILARIGQRDAAREVIDALAATARDRYVPPYATALIYAGLENYEAAFAWLEKAFAARDVHLVFLTIDPKWDALRNDPRFASLLARCGFDRA